MNPPFMRSLPTKRLLLIVMIFTINEALAQASGPQFFRSGVMNGNNIYTVFGNWGVIGQPVDTRPRGAWMQPGNGYIGDESFFIGIELPIKDYNNDAIPDTVHSVVTCPVNRPSMSRDESPLGSSWTFMPQEGCFNPTKQGVAMSNDPSSWPSAWNGKWNGLAGAGILTSDLESYYRVDDQNDMRFNVAQNNRYAYIYHPDSTNYSRTGQGLQVAVRFVQYNDPFTKDILFRVYDITNTSTNTYDKMVFGYLMGTYVGVSGANTDYGMEYSDDYSVLLKDHSVVITGDFDNNCSRNPFWTGSVGKFGNAFIESPGNTIASYRYFTPANDISLGDDERLWKILTPGTYSTPNSITNDTVVAAGADGDYTMGTNYFSLKAGQTKRVISILAYGNSNEEIQQKLQFAKIYNSTLLRQSPMNSKIVLKSLTSQTTISSVKEIQWHTTQTGGSVDIYLSTDVGGHWSPIASDVPNSGSFQWNTTISPDCALGKIYIVLKDSARYPVDLAVSSLFTINNAVNGTPIIYFPESTNPFRPGAVIVDTAVTASVYVADPESSDLKVTMLYDAGNGFIQLHSQVIHSQFNLQSISFNLEAVPNSTSLKLRFDVSDGTTASSWTTGQISKQNIRSHLSPSQASFISKNSTYGIDVDIVDPPKLTQDNYIISFNDTAAASQTTFSVFNATRRAYAVSNALLTVDNETQVFDGLALKINGNSTELEGSAWSTPRLQNLKVSLSKLDLDLDRDGKAEINGYRHPCDYTMIFYNTVVDTTIPVWASYGLAATPLNYKIFNSRNEQVKIAFDQKEAGVHSLYFYENVAGKKKYTWELDIIGNALPAAGDTLVMTTKKGFSIYDSLQINRVLSVRNGSPMGPVAFQLTQNYPNPFNPSTIIRYHVPSPGKVRLFVYDLLGREIAMLVDTEQTAGWKMVEWNGKDCSSGIYFYRLQTENFIETKKMVLIR
jgi:hypothetical protein